jgi:hypothetical protein
VSTSVRAEPARIEGRLDPLPTLRGGLAGAAVPFLWVGGALVYVDTRRPRASAPPRVTVAAVCVRSAASIRTAFLGQRGVGVITLRAAPSGSGRGTVTARVPSPMTAPIAPVRPRGGRTSARRKAP